MRAVSQSRRSETQHAAQLAVAEDSNSGAGRKTVHHKLKKVEALSRGVFIDARGLCLAPVGQAVGEGRIVQRKNRGGQ